MFQASVVQMLHSAIHRINHYPADKYKGNQLHLIYPMDSDGYPPFEQLGLEHNKKKTTGIAFIWFTQVLGCS